jgi:uncharacterized protein (TIGR02271 family)
MPSKDQLEVTGNGGLRGFLLDPVPRDPDQPVRIEIGDKRVLEVPAGLLTVRSDGSYTVPFSPEDIDRMAEDTRVPGTGSASEQTVIPVVAEELDVRKRSVQTGGIRVHRRVLEHEEEIDMPLLREDVQVRRVLLDREVDGPLPIRRDGETIIIPVVEEVLVVSRRYRLKEEVYVTKTTRQERHQERVTVRRQEADIQEFDANGRRVT